MRAKKFMALLLAFAMFCSVIILPQAVLAFDDGNPGAVSEERANLSFYYVGATANATTLPTDFTEKAFPTGGLQQGQVIWIAVQLSNAKTFLSEATKANSSAGAEGGLKSITFAMDYDTRYLSPAGRSRDIFGTNTLLGQSYPKADLGSGTPVVVYSMAYNTDATKKTMSTSSNEPSGLTSPANGMTSIQQLSLSGDAYDTDPRLFKGDEITDDPTVYGLFAFSVEAVPSPGTKILQAALAKDTLVFDVGFSGSAPTLAWNVLQQSGDTNENLKNYLNITTPDGKASDGTINLFPNTYTIKYNLNDTDTENQATYSGDENDLTTQTVVEDKAIDSYLPDSTKLTKPGKLFAGWYLDAAGSDNKKFTAGENGTVVTADMVNESNELLVYAKWVDGYSITIDPNGGSFGSSTDPIVHEYPSTDTPPASDFPSAAPQREGYTFTGYNNVQNGSGNITVSQDNLVGYDYKATSIALFAQWEVTNEADEVTVSFVVDEADATQPAPTSISLLKGTAIGAEGRMPTKPTRTNYTFKEWNTASNGTGTPFTHETEVNADTNVYAQWEINDDVPEANIVTFTFKVADSDKPVTQLPNPEKIRVVKDGSGNAKIGEPNMPTPPQKDGKVFEKWLIESTTTEFTGETEVTADTTLVAQFKDAVDVTFHANGGVITGTDPAAETKTVDGYGTGDTIAAGDIPTATREGYTFYGWMTKKDGSGTKLDTSYVLTAGTTFYALWQAAADPDGDGDPDDPDEGALIVEFNGNGGTAPTPSTRYLKAGDALNALYGDIGTDNVDTLPKATRTNYEMTEWNTTPGGTGTTVTAATTRKALEDAATGGKVTLYAQWRVDDAHQANKVTLSVYKNMSDLEATAPAVDPIKTYEVVSGDSLGFPLDAPAWAGLTLAGWMDENVDPFYPVGDGTNTATTITADMSVCAKWSGTLSFTITDITKVYNGEQQGVTVSKIEVGSTDVTADLAANKDYFIIYTDNGTEMSAGTKPTNAGEYAFEASFPDVSLTDVVTAYLMETGNDMEDPTFTITPASVSFALAADGSQSAKISDDSKDIKLTATATLKEGDPAVTETLVQNTDFAVKFFKLADPENWTVPEGSTWILGSDIGKLQDAIGSYIAKIEISNGNYQVGSLDENIQCYGEGGTATDRAQRMKFTVTPDIELNGFKVVASDAANFDTPKTSYDSDFTTAKPFNKEATDQNYYISAGVDEDIKIQFAGTLGAGSTITLKRPGKEDVAIEPGVRDDATGTYTTGAIELDPANGTNNGVSNTIEINLTGTAEGPIYTIYVRQLVEAKIVLNPGNSPYGLIERMGAEYHKEGDTWTPWTAEEITAAKEAFANSDPADGNLHYATIGDEEAARVPNGGQTEYSYSKQAWQEAGASTVINKNYDLDSDAMFVYYDTKIQDVGLKVFDSNGNEPTDLVVTAKVELDNYKGGLPTYTDTDFEGNDAYGTHDYGVQNKPVSELIYDISLLAIRPNIYDIEYTCTYTDSATSQITELTITRPLIVVARRGDVQINLGGAAVNPGDASTLTQSWGQIASRSKLFAFRIADVQTVSTSENAINPGDASTLTQRWGSIGQSTSTQYYTSLVPEP